MTAFLARTACTHCGNILVPPILASVRMDALDLDTDYVCLACGGTYRWIGNPPTLTMLRAILPSTSHHDRSQPNR